MVTPDKMEWNLTSRACKLEANKSTSNSIRMQTSRYLSLRVYRLLTYNLARALVTYLLSHLLRRQISKATIALVNQM